MLDYETIAKNKAMAHNMRLVHMTTKKAVPPESQYTYRVNTQNVKETESIGIEYTVAEANYVAQ